MSSAGRYFALDGPDGCGKTTQTQQLAHWLGEECGREVLHVREPGSTRLGETLRALLLDPATGALRPLTEVLLFSAARGELLRQQIAPALERGAVVLAERCWLSTLVYQGLAPANDLERVDSEWIRTVTAAVHGELWPACVFVLDVDARTAELRRTRTRASADRIEERGVEFHQRVRESFLVAARSEPRAVVVDATRPFDEVQRDLRARVGALLDDAGARA